MPSVMSVSAAERFVKGPARFFAPCAVAFLALLGAAYQLRMRQLRHQFEVTLDARLSERTRLARDIHDTLLQSFQGLLPLQAASLSRTLSKPESPAQSPCRYPLPSRW